jgi:signal peptidase
MSDSGGGSPHPDDDGSVADADEPSRSPSERVDRAEQNGGAVGPHDRRPPPRPAHQQTAPDPAEQPLRWYFETDRPLVVASRDVLSSVLLVTMVGLALFAVSGVWPPLVAVESGSMEPNMVQGDLVLVVEDERFASQLADEHGIVTQRDAIEQNADHRQFGEPGSVIVFRPDGESGTPIIHRVAFAVEEGDNWVATADPAHLGSVDECSDVGSCPAEYDGYITRGDANAQYDQVAGQSGVVRPGWVRGRAVSRVPYLGCVRLALSEGGICGA